MEITARVLILILLTLLQVTTFPINFGFAFLVAQSLLVADFQFVSWIVVVAFLVSVFGNINFGIVLIAFTLSMLVIFLVRKLFPDNRITKVVIVAISLPLANIGLLLSSRILQ